MTTASSIDPPSVTLVTVTYNAANVFDDFWRSLVAQEGVRWSLIVVDNASADATLATLASIEKDPRVTIVRSSTNTGAAEGNNIGLRQAKVMQHDYIALCNNDIVFEPTALAQLTKAKQSLPHGAVTPVLVFEDNPGVAWFEMGEITTRLGVRCVHQSAGKARPATLYPTTYAPTTFLLFDRIVIEVTGELDDAYFAYWEDADYVWRATRNGFGIWVDPETIVVHKVSQSSGGFGSAYSNHQYYKNQVRFSRKHLGRAVCGYTVLTSLLRIAARRTMRLDPAELTRAKLNGLLAGVTALRHR